MDNCVEPTIIQRILVNEDEVNESGLEKFRVIVCNTQIERHPRRSPIAVTDTDEDVCRTLITDDSHLKRSGMCVWVDACVVVEGHSCDTHVEPGSVKRAKVEPGSGQRAKVELGSGKHSVYTHVLKDPNCDICMKTKITRASCRTRTATVVPREEHFSDLITADHKVPSEESESRNNHRYAVVVQDLATQWIQSYPCKTKTSQETQKSLMKFLEPTRKPKVIHIDNSSEFGGACEDLSCHCTSTPHRSETNGIAERAVRRVKEGTSAVLLQSCLGNVFATFEEFQDLLSNGKTSHERRFGVPFNGPVILFGISLEYHFISAKDISRLHQSGPKVLPGIFLGYALNVVRIWKGGDGLVRTPRTRAFCAMRFTTMLHWWRCESVLKSTFNEKSCESPDGNIIVVYVFTRWSVFFSAKFQRRRSHGSATFLSRAMARHVPLVLRARSRQWRCWLHPRRVFKCLLHQS